MLPNPRQLRSSNLRREKSTHPIAFRCSSVGLQAGHGELYATHYESIIAVPEESEYRPRLLESERYDSLQEPIRYFGQLGNHRRTFPVRLPTKISASGVT